MLILSRAANMSRSEKIFRYSPCGCAFFVYAGGVWRDPENFRKKGLKWPGVCVILILRRRLIEGIPSLFRLRVITRLAVVFSHFYCDLQEILVYKNSFTPSLIALVYRQVNELFSYGLGRWRYYLCLLFWKSDLPRTF